MRVMLKPRSVRNLKMMNREAVPSLELKKKRTQRAAKATMRKTTSRHLRHQV